MEDLKKEYFKRLLEIKNDIEKFALFLTHNRDLSKDLVSDTVVSGFNSFGNLKNQDAFKSYILKICYRIHLNQKQLIKRSELIDTNTIDELYPAEMPGEQLYDIGLLYEAIESLTDIDKQVIVLSELMGFKHKEISKITGLSVANIKVKTHRAKKELSKMIIDKKIINEIIE